MIKQLNQDLKQDLCAQQVITTMPDCIKQLLQNSIDAHATKIRIYLEDYGKKKIQISDNGIGIADFSFIGKKGSTSKNKINTSIKTLGFRGQALNSIARVSQGMIIQSRTKQQSQSIIYNLKTSQKIISKKPINKGTNIIIQQLFKYLPVRKQQFYNRYRDFLKILVQTIKQYCLIYPQIGILLFNNRQTKQDLLIEVGAHPKWDRESWKQRINDIYGNKIGDNLRYIKTQLVEGWLLNKIQSGSGKQNTYLKKNIHNLFLNRRPIDKISSIQILIQSYYKKFNNYTKSLFILNLTLQEQYYDVNLSPNKRQIFIRRNIQQKILQQIKLEIQENVIQDIPKLEDFHIKKSHSQKNFKDTKQIKNNYNTNKSQIIVNQQNPIKLQIKNNLNKKKQQINIIQNQKPLKNSIFQQLNRKMGSKIKQSKDIHSETPKVQIKTYIPNKSRQQNQINKRQQKFQKLQIKQYIPQQKRMIIQVEPSKQSSQINNINNICFTDISSSFKKQQFSQFIILGQFNHGFIICLFQDKFLLIDQHAASQKIKYQKLMNQPYKYHHTNQILLIDLILADTIQNKINSLKQDGFLFQIQDRSKIIFSRYPTFLDQIFGKNQFIEIVQQNLKLKDLSKVRNMAASKACRSAVMVGDVLNQNQMKKIVHNLAQLNSPWNCPHGRPTLIELGLIKKFTQQIKQVKNYIL